MYSVAASCPVPSIRFVVYQLISRFIEHCNEEARVFVFLDLFHNCTYPAMLAAAVSLFKQQIDAAFKSTVSFAKQGNHQGWCMEFTTMPR